MNDALNLNQESKPELNIDVLEEMANIKTLILFNDDINSFEHVIQALMDICSFSQMQAEQCATIAHYSGKCPLLEGDHDILHPMYVALQNRKLTVEIS